MENTDKFVKAFEYVRSLGRVKTNRKGNTGIGKTLEDIIGVEENNLDAPDLHGYEIKSQRNLSSSYVTLFTKAPTYPKRVNNTLRLDYGSYDERFPDIKVLHTSVFATRWNSHKSGYSYRLQVDESESKVSLKIREASSENIIKSDIFWDAQTLNKIFSDKLQNLAFIQAHNETINGEEYFLFEKCTLFHGVSLQKFLAQTNEGNIMFDIRIGAYKNINKPKTYGKTHDHGSGFRIKREKLALLYDTVIEI